MVLASDIGSMLESNPAYWGGRPYVRGKGVTVHRIAIAHSHGLSPAEIATDYGLELAEVPRHWPTTLPTRRHRCGH